MVQMILARRAVVGARREGETSPMGNPSVVTSCVLDFTFSSIILLAVNFLSLSSRAAASELGACSSTTSQVPPAETKIPRFALDDNELGAQWKSYPSM